MFFRLLSENITIKIYQISYLSFVLDKSRISSHKLVEEERIINTKFGVENSVSKKVLRAQYGKGLTTAGFNQGTFFRLRNATR